MSEVRHVVLAVPGSGVGQGGIVRQMQYLFQGAANHDEKICFHWLPTHSNNFLWPFYYLISFLRFCLLSLLGSVDVLYLSLASRGSFYRKWLLFKVARLFRIKCVVHLHGGGFQQFYEKSSPSIQARTRELFTGADAVIVLGEQWQKFVETLGVASEKIFLVYNTVPTPEAYEKQPNQEPHIIFLGHLVHRKGIGELITALEGLQEIPWRATFAGFGELEHYQEEVQKLGLEERISFPGWLDDAGVTELYQQADILVLPSHIENQPMCLLEAMSHRLALVATSVGTVPEILTDKEDSLLVPPGDPQALKEALEKVLTDEGLRKKIANNAHSIQSIRHCLEVYCYSIEKIILEL